METELDLITPLDRLYRHFSICVGSQDLISLLDLSHSLRGWDDLRLKIKNEQPSGLNKPIFTYENPSSKLCNLARKGFSIISCLPNKTYTSANNGTIVSGGKLIKDRPFYLNTNARQTSNGYLVINSFTYIESKLNEMDFKEIRLYKGQKNKVNFECWMKSEIVRVYNYNNQGVIPISREVIIKRMANAFGGSHPVDPVNELSETDKILKELLEFTVGGLGLPYFLLMSIAKEILEKMPLIIGQPKYKGILEET